MTDDDGHSLAPGTASAGQVRYARTHGLPLTRTDSSSDANTAIRAHKQSAKGSANMPKRRRTAKRNPWGDNAPSKVLLIQNALKHGKPYVYGTVLSQAAWEYDDGLLTLTFTGKPTLARQATQAASWIEGVVAETLGGECKVVINDA